MESPEEVGTGKQEWALKENWLAMRPRTRQQAHSHIEYGGWHAENIQHDDDSADHAALPIRISLDLFPEQRTIIRMKDTMSLLTASADNFVGHIPLPNLFGFPRLHLFGSHTSLHI